MKKWEEQGKRAFRERMDELKVGDVSAMNAGEMLKMVNEKVKNVKGKIEKGRKRSEKKYGCWDEECRYGKIDL